MSLGCGWAAIMTPRRVTFIKPLIVVIVNTAADLDGVLFSVFVFSFKTEMVFIDELVWIGLNRIYEICAEKQRKIWM